MPAVSEKQRRFMGAELARKRAGKKTKTNMSKKQLGEFASKEETFAKSIDLIDVYLFKHGRILPCGHHAEEGSDIDKACSISGCDAVPTASSLGAGQGPQTSAGGNLGAAVPVSSNPTVATSLPTVGSTSTGNLGGRGSGETGDSGGDTVAPSSTGRSFSTTDMITDSADSITLINRYLDKQSRVKCKHKKGDPNHLEGA